MTLSSRTRSGQCKSSSGYEACRNLRRSRDTQAGRARSKMEEIRRLRGTVSRQDREIGDLKYQLQQERLQNAELRVENGRLRQQPLGLPDDPPLPHHSYGAKMIALSVNLSQVVGLRAAETALRTFFEWLGVKVEIPHWTTIRSWLCRCGVALLEEPLEAADDWIWVVDHSNQIGPEKVLAILGIRGKHLPPQGQPLRHQDMRVLELVPAVRWKREDVAKQYAALAERVGEPLAVLSDAAVELRESTAVLKKPGKALIELRDFKHHAANVMSKVVGKDARFAEFLSHIGRSRSAIQQTELAHLTPPPQKPKSRFMNLAATLKWAEMVTWQLSHPQSWGCRDILPERMDEKLGWLKDFSDDVARWSRCQAVVSESLTWVNQQGVYPGAADALKRELRGKDLGRCEASRRVMDDLVLLVAETEKQLQAGMRLPLSTEILESSFGRYKALERQHSKGGFTSLLAAFPALLRRSTPEAVRAAFARVPVARLKEWTSRNLGHTLAAKRTQAYAEFSSSTAVAK